ncbi:MAG: S8 family serine peptidase, partial [Chloroflexota bacterium]|nr:S8 family serine peptidase [Chloroflexota bacterium]
CPLCGLLLDQRVLGKSLELRPPIARLIRQAEPTWQPAHGICPRCAYAYVQKFAKERAAQSLHTLTEPPTTFPYYHLAEESVLAQPQRLPDYPAFAGRGVTIAFLDSGYYPHPDLSTMPTGLEMPDWSTLSAEQWQMRLRESNMRLAQYVDLTGDGERIGLDQPSLWSGAGDSWHGQMTTVLAAGNGLLSNGYFRGYAPGAGVLAIKIGRGGGRIPEADILRGLQWLLRDDQWQRYGVRVLNISVGGDFAEAWQANAVCQAAEELSARGVLITAAAGNRGREELLAPAQAPSVLTVGGYDDGNRRWHSTESIEHLELYPHNYGTVVRGRLTIAKPELLAPARWLPSPILPINPIFQAMMAIGELRAILHRYTAQDERLTTTVAPADTDQTTRPTSPSWQQAAWQAVRQGMNAHKWVHRHYQHVDGTSVAVAQVSAVAAQMCEANPRLTVNDVRALLLATALSLAHPPAALTGHGILQPAQAVAAALRAPNGLLTGLPYSATVLDQSELHKWQSQGKVPVVNLAAALDVAAVQALYFGYYAPHAAAVSLIGTFTSWQPNHLRLQPWANGWWHSIVCLPPGHHLYRFWIDSGIERQPEWQPDPENLQRTESGYEQDHSVIIIN